MGCANRDSKGINEISLDKTIVKNEFPDYLIRGVYGVDSHYPLEGQEKALRHNIL